ncbi:hypothetical protein F4680DRAFT_427932 [Xylaria scruposa]|nr:hypothetical protein F4680DRAFT_427932 [Xylaria scruposa]
MNQLVDVIKNNERLATSLRARKAARTKVHNTTPADVSSPVYLDDGGFLDVNSISHLLKT